MTRQRIKAWSNEAKEAESEARTLRLQRTLSAIDRILSPRVIAVEVLDAGSKVPGWTDGSTVTLNPNGLPPLLDDAGNIDTRALVVWLGINSHEVGHTLFTPGAESLLDAKIKAITSTGMYPGLRRVWNMVEDQRMERLVIGRFYAWRTYLTAASVELIHNAAFGARNAGQTDMGPKTWPLMVGRTWLPPAIRRQARDAWSGDGRELARLVGEYQRLGDPGYDDADDALELVTAIYNLLREGDVDPSDMGEMSCTNPNGAPNRETMVDQDFPDRGDVDDDLVPSAGSPEDDEQLDHPDPGDIDDSDAGGDEGESDADADTDADAGSDGEPGEGEGSGSGDDANDGDDQAGDGSADGADGSDTQMSDSADDPDGDGTGQGDTSESTMDGGQGIGSGPPSLDDLADAVDDMVKESLASDAEVREDVNRVREGIEGRPPRSTLDQRPQAKAGKKRRDHEVTPEVARLARSVSKHLRLLVDAALPQWTRRTEAGKLNVGRYMRREVGDPLDDIFDRFDMGQQDDVSLDVTILLDVSSSMTTRPDWNDHPTRPEGLWPAKIESATEAAWAIRRAVDLAEGECQVIAFDMDAWMEVPPGRRPSPTTMSIPPATGGTDPSKALKETWARLASGTVEAAHKVVVVVSDGQWYGGGDLMRDLGDQGITTIGVQLEPYCKRPPLSIEQAGPKFTKEYMDAEQEKIEHRSKSMGCTYTEVMDNPHGMVELFDQVVKGQMAEMLMKGGQR